MLCQLVCIDRRYQRMNCFNIREVQTLLRSKYHPTFLDVLEHHQLLEYTTIGLRYKLFGLDPISSNMSLAFEHGIYKVPTDRDTFYTLSTLKTENTFYTKPSANFFNNVYALVYNLLLQYINPTFTNSFFNSFTVLNGLT